MKKLGLLLFTTLGVLFSSCIKHEVIPPPVPMVDLYSHFVGKIDGAQIELTENVLGYTNISQKSKIILPPPSFSQAVYYSKMSSSQVATSIEIGLGSVIWDATVEADPGLAAFNNFFLTNTNPNYSNNGANGFEVIYRDGFGNVWKSEETSTRPKDVEFYNIVQDSDSTGDYSLFSCDFNCTLYRTYYDATLMQDVTDSATIQNATYTGWFKR